MKLDHLLGFRFAHASLPHDSREAQTLFGCIMQQKDIAPGFNVLQRLPIIWKWYELIAQANGLQPENSLVHKAYWLGSSLLERPYDFSGIHEYVTTNFRHAEFFDPPKPGTFPHHNPGHVGTYSILSKPDAPEEDIAMCFVRLAIAMDETFVSDVVIPDLSYHANPFELPFEKGTPVAVHRGIVCAVLDPGGVANLRKFGSSKKYEIPIMH